MYKDKVIIGVDPGLTGGIVVLFGDETPKVYKMPINVVVKNKKKKRHYDVKKIVDIVKKYDKKDIVFAIERQSTRPGEGNVSSHTNGQNYGILQGIGYCIEANVLIILPRTWKKHFPDLSTDVFVELRDGVKDANNKYKNEKDKCKKKQYKKDVEKIRRCVKSEAKRQSREICKKLYPSISYEFNKVSDDGKSDAMLIALYVRDNLNELVSNNSTTK